MKIEIWGNGPYQLKAGRKVTREVREEGSEIPPTRKKNWSQLFFIFIFCTCKKKKIGKHKRKGILYYVVPNHAI